jgi:glutathione synthase/RimK-type ligase-like ATP-grasp enzyme
VKRRLAILTPDPVDPQYAERWPAAFDRLRELFAVEGVEAVPAPWIEPLPDSIHAVLAQLAWGYHRRPDAWRALVDKVAAPIINPPAVLRWNTRKTYLLELAAKRAPVIPTLAMDRVEEATLDALFDALHSEILVVKPQVSAGSHLTLRVRRGDRPRIAAEPMLIQPYLDSITEEGELSLFYFDGVLSHAVRKVATGGDFRVQPRFGGRFTLFKPDVEMVAAAEAVLAAAPSGIVYARIDLIRDGRGQLVLMELEAIEPDLYLNLAPDGGAAFVQAVCKALI